MLFYETDEPKASYKKTIFSRKKGKKKKKKKLTKNKISADCGVGRDFSGAMQLLKKKPYNKGIRQPCYRCIFTETCRHRYQRNATVDLQNSLLRSALHFAAINGSIACVKRLIEHNASIEAVDQELHTPLHLSVMNNKLESVKLLLSMRANMKFVDYNGVSVVSMAADCGCSEILELLLDLKGDVQSVDWRGMSALHHASAQGDVKCISLLLNYKANICCFDMEGRSPIHHAVMFSKKEAVEALLSYEMKMRCKSDQLNSSDEIETFSPPEERLIDAADIEGYTALHEAASAGYYNLVITLLDFGANPTIPDRNEWTPRIHALYCGHLQLGALLEKAENDFLQALTLGNGKNSGTYVVSVKPSLSFKLSNDNSDSDAEENNTYDNRLVSGKISEYDESSNFEYDVKELSFKRAVSAPPINEDNRQSLKTGLASPPMLSSMSVFTLGKSKHNNVIVSSASEHNFLEIESTHEKMTVFQKDSVTNSPQLFSRRSKNGSPDINSDSSETTDENSKNKIVTNSSEKNKSDDNLNLINKKKKQMKKVIGKCRVEFVVRARLLHDQYISIVGDCAELGNWDTRMGVKLKKEKLKDDPDKFEENTMAYESGLKLFGSNRIENENNRMIETTNTDKKLVKSRIVIDIKIRESDLKIVGPYEIGETTPTGIRDLPHRNKNDNKVIDKEDSKRKAPDSSEKLESSELATRISSIQRSYIPFKGANKSLANGKSEVPENTFFCVSYKYVVRSSDSQNIEKYEVLPINRKVMLYPKKHIMIDDGMFGMQPKKKIAEQLNKNKNEEENKESKIFEKSQGEWVAEEFLVTDLELRITLGHVTSKKKNDPLYFLTPVDVESIRIHCGKLGFAEQSKVLSHSLPLDNPLHVFKFKVPATSSHEYLNVRFDAIGALGIVASAWVLASTFLDKLEGTLQVPLLQHQSNIVIGELNLEFLIVKPFQHPMMNTALGRAFSRSTKVIGHRGAGAEKSAVSGLFRRSHITENTILSFVAASSLGAQYIEFDVQLTRDMVPVVYHDWLFKSKKSDFRAPVCNITLSEFMQNTNYVRKRSRSIANTRELVKSKAKLGLAAELGVSNEDFDFLTSCNEERIELEETKTNTQIEDRITTLVEAFLLVPASTGFNIEIKYPLLHEIEQYQLHFFDLNTFVDVILKTVFEHARERPIIFSSFHPDICTLLSLKQPRYPVFFLTLGGDIRTCDPRSASIREAVRFAKSSNLLGLVSWAKPLVEAPQIISHIKSSGLLLCTWGEENNDRKKVELQENYGVDSIITDHVAYITEFLHPN